MKRSSIIYGLFITLLVLSANAVAAPGGAVPNRYLVRFKAALTRDHATRALEAQGLRVQDYLPQIDLYVADSKNPRGLRAHELAQLQASPEVLYIEKDATWTAIAAPNDPLYAQQAEVKRLSVETAWDRTTGSSSVIVAVSDTGVAMDHPDLNDHINPDGFNFINNTANPTDDNGHGTHVSGIIGAEGNNAEGIAGVNWRVQIQAVKFLDSNGSGATVNGVKTLLHAADHGARVINCSWSGGAASDALRDAINYAFSKGALVIAAAGNNAANSDTTPVYPAGYRVPGVLAIASSQGEGSLSGFSNFGARTVAFAAPGSDVLSTFLGGRYQRLSGTSMAAPMASGVAALILSVAPQLTSLELRNALVNAVNERASYAGRLSTSGDLNANLAVTQLDGGFQVWPARASIGVGEQMQFSTYRASGAVTWSSGNAAIASVNAQGIVRGVAAGRTLIIARNAANQTASTQWVQVVSPPPPPPGGGGGCNRSLQDFSPASAGSLSASVPMGESDPWDSANSVLSLSLPLIGAVLVRRRRR